MQDAPSPMDQQSTHYTVLARRFRPQTFEEVIGQEHVAGGLRNAISTGRVAHAYLFTGARGVGKTSMARILAKTLNCSNPNDGQPCHECDVCQSIAAGQDVDVLEIDGASNRRIDDIRDLRRNVGVKSMRSPYKIYIIDEVHQLTTEAFNALLKTLEEPPENVKFIFCTTEPSALPDTIVSRCQRFDFGLIGLDRIAARLTAIAEAEGVSVSDDAVELVARRSGGSMRDSQSLFDQLLAFGQEQVDATDVHRLLGTAPDELLLAIIQPLVQRRPHEAIVAFEAALSAGAQQDELLGQLIECSRDLMVQATGADGVVVRSVGPMAAQQMTSLAADWGVETAIAAMQVLAETVSRSRWTRQSRALADLALVRIATLEQLSGVSGWLQQLVGGGAGPDQKKTVDSLNSLPHRP
ncbi:DNA polymerase III subunit gamma/tau, partial [Planctomycetaceae bacterium]|nr:DNA polymerase III subunit gamma/tau [Planctomycetaceae bacterium]